MRFDPGRDAQHHLRAPAERSGDRIRALELFHRVGDDATDAGLQSHLDLGVALVVAVEDDPLRRERRLQGREEFAAAGDVETEAFLGHHPGHRDAEERLARVVHVGVRVRFTVTARALAESVLAHYEQRRAELARKVDCVGPADLQVAVRAQARARRKDIFQRVRHLLIPSRVIRTADYRLEVADARLEICRKDLHGRLGCSVGAIEAEVALRIMSRERREVILGVDPGRANANLERGLLD